MGATHIMTDALPTEIRWFFRTLLRRWYLVLIPVVVVGGYVFYTLLTTPPAQSSGFTTVIRFSAAQSIDALPDREGDFQDVWLSSELTVKALTSWAQTTSFKSEVAARAAESGVTFEPNALATAADHERSVGQLFISWNNASELEIIAAAALDVLREDSQTYFPQFGDQPAQVTVLDDIRVNPNPPPIVDRFEPLVQVALAVLVGVGLAFLAEYMDPTVRYRDELERSGFEVIASIPRE
jgi:capsular polysaccharide biosynthesis protein